MMQGWNQYRSALLARAGDYAKQSPDVLKGLATIENAATKSGHLEPKLHELFALAVAVTTRCDGCISVHTKKAVEHVATLEEISEALGVAIASTPTRHWFTRHACWKPMRNWQIAK